MHKVIRFIIEAENKEKALEIAKYCGDEILFGEGRTYDCGAFFDEDGNSTSGKGRWGNLPDAVLSDSKEGKKLINEGIKYAKADFMNYIKKVREILKNYKDEDIFEEEVVNIKTKMLQELSNEKKEELYMAKYYFNKLGYNREANLYDENGEAIITKKQLNKILKGKGTKFVIPCDVHF